MRIFSSPRRTLRLLAAAAALAGFVPVAATQSRPSPAKTTSYDLSSLPAASEYRTDVPGGRGFLGSESAVLGRSLARINKALGISLQPDNRLARLARWVYERFEADRSMPPQSTLDLLAHHLGLSEPLPHMLMTYAHDAPRLANVVSARLAKVFDLAEYTHIGGVAERVTAGVVVVIALSRRHVKMAPLPRSLAGPGRLPLEGSLLDGFTQPKLAHTLPGGETRIETLGKGPAFSASVDLRATGRHRLEVMATGRGGPEVIVNFPVYVGVPVQGTVEAAPEPRRAMKPDQAQSRLFGLINEERTRAGLGTLAFDDELSSVALSHSEDMRKNDFVSHISPTAGGPEERLLEAGIVTDVAAENVGLGYNPEEIHKGLMDSPGHRAAILQPKVTHVGIGISSGKKGEGTDYVVTELFIHRILPLGPDAKLFALGEIIASRELGGQPPLEEDPVLSGLAEEAARGFLEDPMLTQNDVMGRLQQRLERSGPRIGTAAAVISVAGSIKEGFERMTLDPKPWANAKRVGVGIAQGTRPGFVPNSIVMILIFVE